MLGNIGRVNKLVVVVGESGRGLNIILRNHNSPVDNSPFSHTWLDLTFKICV
jgi:hypothetical protein